MSHRKDLVQSETSSKLINTCFSDQPDTECAWSIEVQEYRSIGVAVGDMTKYIMILKSIQAQSLRYTSQRLGNFQAIQEHDINKKALHRQICSKQQKYVTVKIQIFSNLKNEVQNGTACRLFQDITKHVLVCSPLRSSTGTVTACLYYFHYPHTSCTVFCI